MAELSYTPSERRPGPKPAVHASTNVKFLVLGGSQSSSTPGFHNLLGGVSRAMSRMNLRLFYSHVNDEATFARELRSEPIDGLLLHGRLPGADLERHVRDLPTVWIMGNRTQPNWGDQVRPSASSIGELAAETLASRGHKLVTFLNLDATFWPFRLYEHAFADRCESLGVRCGSITRERQMIRSYWEPHDPKLVGEIVAEVLAADPRPTGLFVADDMQVAQLQPALQRAGLEIGPGAVEVVSCNNEVPYLAGLHPRPMSIDIRLAAVGERAVEQLKWRIAHRHVEERLTLLVHPHAPHLGT